MEELTIGDKTYISSKRAAEITGYAKDYIGQLCREGRVNATLVGRSWYVLESSLRAHRFGEADSENKGDSLKDIEEKELPSTWDVPIYKSETTTPVPDLVPKSSINVLEQPHNRVIAEEEGAETVQDMQNAWKEWFANRQKQPEETIQEPVQAPEEEEIQELEDKYVQEIGSSVEEIAQSVQESPITEEEEVVEVRKVYADKIEENVSIRKTYDIPHAQAPILTTKVPQRTSAPRKGSSSRAGSRSSLPVKAMFIVIIVMSAVITTIGSGLVDQTLDANNLQNSFTRFLSGTYQLDK